MINFSVVERIKIPRAIENSKIKDHAVPDNKDKGKRAIHSRHISLCLEGLFSQTTLV